jgi:hypothetical protein
MPASFPDYSADAASVVDTVATLLVRGMRAEAADLVAGFLRLAHKDGEIAGMKRGFDVMERAITRAAETREAGHA